MKQSNLDGARKIALKRGALLVVLALAAAAAGSAVASCDDTGPSPIGDHPDDAEVDSAMPDEDATDEGGEGGEEAGGDGGSDARDAADAKDTATADADAGD